MKDAIGAVARSLYRHAVGDVGDHDLELLLAAMLFQIGLATHRYVVDDTYSPSVGNQPIDEVAADKATPARNDI
jgi:hypothetical protein